MNQNFTYQSRKFKSFDEELKVNLKTRNLDEERKKFIEYISNNAEILSNFSEGQLVKLLKYIEAENEKKRMILNGNNF